MSTLLECKTLPPAHYCLKLGNILGVPQSAIVDGFSSQYGKASNLSLDTNRFTQGNTIVTSKTGRINITLPRNVQIPTSAKAKTWFGEEITIIVTSHFEYTGQPPKAPRAPPSNNASSESAAQNIPGQNSLYKTKMCRNPTACTYEDRCLYAHDLLELRPNQNGNNVAVPPMINFPSVGTRIPDDALPPPSSAASAPPPSSAASEISPNPTPGPAQPTLSSASVLLPSAAASETSSNSLPVPTQPALTSVSVIAQQLTPALTAPISPTDASVAHIIPEKLLVSNASKLQPNVELQNTSVHSSEVEDPFIRSKHGETSPIGRPDPKISHYIQPILKHIVVSPIRSSPTPTFQMLKNEMSTTPPPWNHSTTLESSRRLGKNKRSEKSPKGAQGNPNQDLSISPKEAQTKKKTPGLPTSPISTA